MCNKCYSKEERISTTTTFTVNYKGCVIVIKNVPCTECSVCGDKFFSDEVSAKLEDLVKKAKEVLQDVSVIDYQKNVA